MTPKVRARLAFSLAAILPLTAAAAHGERVKYYEVSHAENLTEVARVVLGDPGQAPAILALNVDRAQPGGGRLKDMPTPIDADLPDGWLLILPWDATGDGVHYGELPGGSPSSSPAVPVPVASTAQVAPASAGDEDPVGSRLILVLLVALTGLAVTAVAVRRLRQAWSPRASPPSP